jgi:hypothetical protein
VLNRSLAFFMQPVGLRMNPNVADVTDLVALPMVAVAAWYFQQMAREAMTPERESS